MAFILVLYFSIRQQNDASPENILWVVNLSDGECLECLECLHVGVTIWIQVVSLVTHQSRREISVDFEIWFGHQGRARNLRGDQKGRAKGRQGTAGHRAQGIAERNFAVGLTVQIAQPFVYLHGLLISCWEFWNQFGHQTSSNIIKHQCHINATSMPHQCHINAHIVTMSWPGHGHADGQGPWPWRSCAEGMNGMNGKWDEQAAIRSLFRDVCRKSAEKKVWEAVWNCMKLCIYMYLWYWILQRDTHDTPLTRSAMTDSEEINKDKHVFQSRIFLFDTFKSKKRFSQQGCLPRV